jgi:hypothetical protein
VSFNDFKEGKALSLADLSLLDLCSWFLVSGPSTCRPVSPFSYSQHPEGYACVYTGVGYTHACHCGLMLDIVSWLLHSTLWPFCRAWWASYNNRSLVTFFFLHENAGKYEEVGCLQGMHL